MLAKENVARQVAANSRCWSRNSDQLLKTVLTIAYFDQMGVPDCPDLKLSNRPVRTRMPGGVAGEPPIMQAPYAD